MKKGKFIELLIAVCIIVIIPLTLAIIVSTKTYTDTKTNKEKLADTKKNYEASWFSSSRDDIYAAFQKNVQTVPWGMASSHEVYITAKNGLDFVTELSEKAKQDPDIYDIEIGKTEITLTVDTPHLENTLLQIAKMTDCMFFSSKVLPPSEDDKDNDGKAVSKIVITIIS